MIPINTASITLALVFAVQVGVWVWGIARMSGTLSHLDRTVRKLIEHVECMDGRLSAAERDVAVLKDRHRKDDPGQ